MSEITIEGRTSLLGDGGVFSDLRTRFRELQDCTNDTLIA